MAGFFKKALGVFLEFEEEPQKTEETAPSPNFSQANTNAPKPVFSAAKPALDQSEIEKFEKHFEKLFNQANLPGPDYFEFWKMMETLEAHIHDEKARIAAVFASLSIQGMTKEQLINSAGEYKKVLEKDKAEFENAVNLKAKSDLDGRKASVDELEKKIAANSEMIQKLTKEITEAQGKIGVLKGEIIEEERKLVANKGGYGLASEAMLSKISNDILKIQSIL